MAETDPKPPREPEEWGARKPPCLIIIDWQKAFRDEAYWGARNNPLAQDNCAALLAHWRAKGWPVRHVKHNSTNDASPLRPGLPGNEFEDCAAPQDGEPIYPKQVNSAFIGTRLETDLRTDGLMDLVFIGATTDHCVSTSVRMAANLGFAVTLVADACFTHERAGPGGIKLTAQAMHEAHLASLNGEFAAIVSTHDLITAC